MKAIERIIENGQKVIVRTEKAGVFYGVVTEFENNTAAMLFASLPRDTD